jgi:hypothetical protein
LLWKPIERWISFGEDFATSPAMAGIAAVVAATIGSRALKRQLDHTREEATHARTRDEEASWWEKFEWVTDRILPKDAAQKTLEKPLALALSTSLLNMSTADFQRAAVGGVIDHYLSPVKKGKAQGHGTSTADSSDASPDFLYALQEYVKATQNSPRGSGVASTLLKGTLFELEVKEALRPYVPYKDPSEDDRFDRGSTPDAIITIDGQMWCVEIKAWSHLSDASLYGIANMAALWKHATGLDTVLITTADVPRGWRPSQVIKDRWGDSLRLVQWVSEDGPEVLLARIEDSLGSTKTE